MNSSRNSEILSKVKLQAGLSANSIETFRITPYIQTPTTNLPTRIFYLLLVSVTTITVFNHKIEANHNITQQALCNS